MSKNTYVNIDQWEIPHDFVSVFGSGPSLLDLSPADLELIYSRSYIVGLNLAPMKFKTHAVMWADYNVTDELNRIYRDRPKDREFICRWGGTKANDEPVNRSTVDYHFMTGGASGIKGGFTGIWLMQLLAKYHGGKPILLFGFDLNTRPGVEKWHWPLRQETEHIRRERSKMQGKFDMFHNQCRTIVKPQPHIYNCNPQSRLDVFQKADFQTVLK